MLHVVLRLLFVEMMFFINCSRSLLFAISKCLTHSLVLLDLLPDLIKNIVQTSGIESVDIQDCFEHAYERGMLHQWHISSKVLFLGLPFWEVCSVILTTQFIALRTYLFYTRVVNAHNIWNHDY